MPRFGPIKHNDLIDYLKQLKFDGPYVGGKHQLMRRGAVTIRLPNPHRGDIGREWLARLLRHAHITKDEWEKL